MNTASFIPAETPVYQVSYKRKDTKLLLICFAWILISVIHIVKIYNKWEIFDYWAVVYPISIFAFLFATGKLLLTKTTFSICNKQLTVIKRSLFYKKKTVYEIDRMEELEVEQIMVKKYFLYTEPSGEYAITFLYGKKSMELNANMAKVHAMALLDALLAAKIDGN